VNVALIARYFGNKEGLFRACLAGTADELERSIPEDVTLERLPGFIAQQLTGAKNDDYPTRILLLLRSSGDERADEIRMGILHSFAERLAVMSGGASLLDAQVLLAATLGLAILRSAGLQPLTAADQEQLSGPLHRMINALLA
jgi:AcrR family transcriptional regulator